MSAVDIDLLPHQFDTIADESSFQRILLGGFGAGKTFLLCLWAFLRSLANPPTCKVLIVEPTFKQIDKVLLPTMIEVAGLLNLPLDINQTKRIITHSRGRQIYMESGENPLTMSGMTVACAGIDEPAMQSAEVDNRVVSRVRDPKASIRQILYTGTPEGLGWVYEKTKKVPTIIAPSKSNRHLTADYITNLEDQYSHDPVGAKMYLEGVPMSRSGSIYVAFGEKNAVPCTNPHQGNVVVGMDFNVGLMVTPIARVLGSEIHIFSEVVSRNSRTHEHVPRVVERLKERKLASLRHGSFDRVGLYDRSGQQVDAYMDATSTAPKTSSTTTDHEIVRDAGFWPVHDRGNPAVKERIEAVNYALGNGLLFIDPVGAPFTLDAVRRHEYKRGTSQPMKGRDFPERTDPLDAATDPVGYICFGLSPLRTRNRRAA